MRVLLVVLLLTAAACGGDEAAKAKSTQCAAMKARATADAKADGCRSPTLFSWDPRNGGTIDGAAAQAEVEGKDLLRCEITFEFVGDGSASGYPWETSPPGDALSESEGADLCPAAPELGDACTIQGAFFVESCGT